MLAISTDDLSDAQAIANMVGLAFPILYDPDGDVPRDYGVFNLLGDGLATISTFVIDKSGTIRWKYVGRSISDRPPASVVLDQLRMLEG